MAAKYQDIVNKLELEIRQSKKDGTNKLPSEQDLAKKYSCSRQTVRSALDVLESRGEIVKKKGAGSFIASSSPLSSDEVWLITSDRDGYIMPELIKGLQSRLEKKRLTLRTFSTGNSYKKEKEYLSAALGSKPSCIVICPIRSALPSPNIRLIDTVRDSGIEIVYLFSSYVSNNMTISVDYRSGAELLVRHLSGHGHRNIAGLFLMDDQAGIGRYEGVLSSLQDLNLTFDEDSFMLFTTDDLNDIMRGNRTVLDNFIKKNLPGNSAVICHNDPLAHEFIRLAGKRGIKVPGDISVVSFDNSYYASGEGSITSAGPEPGALINALAGAVISASERRALNIKPVAMELSVRTSG